MAVLVACEFSGTVRDAFLARGVPAVSCDLIGSDSAGGTHIKDDVLNWLHGFAGVRWDALIAFPPCTHLASSGARWWPSKQAAQRDAVEFVRLLYDAPIARVAIENPIGHLSTAWRKPDQIIQPWQFGHGETKATCLWLRGLPKLIPSEIVEGRYGRVWREPPSENRWKRRSLTYAGIAAAMADQWSRHLISK